MSNKMKQHFSTTHTYVLNKQIKQDTSTTRYPQCLAATCASVVFPSPGGPQSRRICKGHEILVANVCPEKLVVRSKLYDYKSNA